MKVAAIDIGTNSTRLLVANVKDKKVEVLHSGLKTTRLGQGVSSTGYLQLRAIDKTLAAIEIFLQQARDWGAKRVVIAATSAARDAVNGEVFTNLVYQHTGCKVTILSGEVEAEMSYRGVLAGLPGEHRVLVLDVGGGSTEISWQQGERVHFASTNVGAVRMTEGKNTKQEITTLLKPLLAKVPVGNAKQLVAVGGTATTVAAMLQQLTVYNPDKVHRFAVAKHQLKELQQAVEKLSLAERRRLPGLQPERADIISAGMTIISAVLELLNFSQFITSEADSIWGLAVSAVLNVEKNINVNYL